MAFNKCNECKTAFCTSLDEDRTPIIGVCKCLKNVCRACVTKLHLEQQSDGNGSNAFVFCLECKQNAFQMDNLIINKNLCIAISSLLSLRDKDAIDVDASGTVLVKKPRRSARRAIPKAPVKRENALEGLFKCPRGCKYAVVTSDKGCNVVTCEGHKEGFRKKDYNHPGFIHFCVHCHIECADNFSVCQCPRRKDKVTCRRILDEKNKCNRDNPIVIDLSPERPSRKKLKEDNVVYELAVSPDHYHYKLASLSNSLSNPMKKNCIVPFHGKESASLIIGPSEDDDLFAADRNNFRAYANSPDHCHYKPGSLDDLFAAERNNFRSYAISPARCHYKPAPLFNPIKKNCIVPLHGKESASLFIGPSEDDDLFAAERNNFRAYAKSPDHCHYKPGSLDALFAAERNNFRSYAKSPARCHYEPAPLFNS